MKRRYLWHWLALCAAWLLLAGCYHIDKFTSHVDMAVTRLAEGAPLEYEGHLVSQQKFGPMIALQFADGRLFDVVAAPPGLIAGDIVRIYKTDKGLEAHLWHRNSVPTQVSFNTHP